MTGTNKNIEETFDVVISKQMFKDELNKIESGIDSTCYHDNKKISIPILLHIGKSLSGSKKRGLTYIEVVECIYDTRRDKIDLSLIENVEIKKRFLDYYKEGGLSEVVRNYYFSLNSNLLRNEIEIKFFDGETEEVINNLSFIGENNNSNNFFKLYINSDKTNIKKSGTLYSKSDSILEYIYSGIKGIAFATLTISAGFLLFGGSSYVVKEGSKLVNKFKYIFTK